MATRSLKLIARRTALALAVTAALGLGATYGTAWWHASRNQETTDDAYVRGDVTLVGSKVAGYVSKLLVGDNQKVVAGQVLLRIDDRDYRARVDQARAALAQAMADAEQLGKREALQRALIAEAGAGARTARAERDLADKDLARSSMLVARGFVAPSRHDAAVTADARAAAVLKRAEAGVAAAQNQLAVIRSSALQIAAREAQARASLRLAQIALADTVVRAPVAGVIGARKVHAGEYVHPGAALLAVVPLRGVWVEANFKETQLAHMVAGQSVRVSIDSFPDTVLRGAVDSFSPGSGAAFSLLPPDNATGNFIRVVQRVPVKIRLAAGDPLAGRLVPGLSAHVSVDIASPPQARADAKQLASAAAGSTRP